MTDVTEESAQDFEADWWGKCLNTFGEEAKQISYARRMGLHIIPMAIHPTYWAGSPTSILDLGGGPVSMLLKTVDRLESAVVDPCPYPNWVAARYKAAEIKYVKKTAESFRTRSHYDECWIYNVLQHVEDPQKVIEVAKRYSDTIRIFEWIGIEDQHGHPHVLETDKLNEWLGAEGTVETGVNMSWEPWADPAEAYYGVFGSKRDA